eukprot:scaffold503_cov81-Cylindrotheca_fusiformis.AAC.1
MKLRIVLLFFMVLLVAKSSNAFLNPSLTTSSGGGELMSMMMVPQSSFRLKMKNSNEESMTKNDSPADNDGMERRQAIKTMLMVGGGMIVFQPALSSLALEPPPNLQAYSDFEMTDEVKEGSGSSPDWGDRVVFDWSGYTIGYFGRPFEAKGGPQGGAFDKDLDFSRAELGKGQIVKGLECAMRSMKPGGIRQVLIPYGPLGYPNVKEGNDASHDRVGPKP